jgi:hypothetical protein
MGRLRTSFILVVISILCSLPVQGTPPGPTPPGLDGRFAELARQVPGFGGYFFDTHGDLNVYLTDLSQEPVARAILAEVAKNRPEGPQHRFNRPAEIVVRHGVYDFSQLDRWHGQMRGVFAIPGVQFLDTDEAANLIRVGVTAEEAVPEVEALAESHGVPGSALIVDVVPPITPVVTLRDYVRPTEGGLHIDWSTLYCSLGINVWYSNPNVGVPVGTAGFFTASHCSTTQGSTDGTVYSQGGLRIAAERWDPPFLSNAQNSRCPLNRRCRWSDATFAAYDAGVSWQLGAIARTLSYGLGLGQPGSIDINSSSPKFTINGGVFTPTMGSYLDKMGRTTGWTAGAVSQTCTDYAQSPDIVIMCQDRVDAFADGGDSGSPVFQWNGGLTVAVAGIVWGKTGTGGFIFSNTQVIQSDFGVGITWF